MPCSTFPIDPLYGPVIDIGIAAPLSLAPTGAPPPPITWIKAIADTGCTHTSIFTDAAKKIGIPVISKTTVNSTTQAVPADVYLADLFLRWSHPWAPGQVFEYPFRDRRMLELIRSTPANEALLGMDIMGIGTMYVNGQNGTATFCW